MATFPSGTPIYVHKQRIPDGITSLKTIIAKSSDEKFLAVTYQEYGLVRIYNLTNWAKVK
jgi:hypothetical protein